MKLIFFLLLTAGVSEFLGFILSIAKIKRGPIYHVYSVVEISLYSICFLDTLKFNRVIAKALLSSFWLMIAILNIKLFQPITRFNSNMLVIEAFSIIAMSIFALYKILLNNMIVNIFKSTLFWIWSLTLFYWCGTFFYWAFIELIYTRGSPYTNFISYFQVAINIIFYAGMAVVFLFYPKSLTE